MCRNGPLYCGGKNKLDKDLKQQPFLDPMESKNGNRKSVGRVLFWIASGQVVKEGPRSMVVQSDHCTIPGWMDQWGLTSSPLFAGHAVLQDTEVLLLNTQRSTIFLPKCVTIGAGTFSSPAQWYCEPSAFPTSLEALQILVNIYYILLIYKSWVWVSVQLLWGKTWKNYLGPKLAILTYNGSKTSTLEPGQRSKFWPNRIISAVPKVELLQDGTP